MKAQLKKHHLPTRKLGVRNLVAMFEKLPKTTPDPKLSEYGVVSLAMLLLRTRRLRSVWVQDQNLANPRRPTSIHCSAHTLMAGQTASSKGLRTSLPTAIVTMVRVLRHLSRATVQLLGLRHRPVSTALQCQNTWTGAAHTADALPPISAILEHASSHAAHIEHTSRFKILITGPSALAANFRTRRKSSRGKKCPRSSVKNAHPSLHRPCRSQRCISGLVDEQRPAHPRRPART
jgi:hypothetical protein